MNYERAWLDYEAGLSGPDVEKDGAVQLEIEIKTEADGGIQDAVMENAVRELRGAFGPKEQDGIRKIRLVKRQAPAGLSAEG